MKTIVRIWKKIPTPLQKWLKGLEVAVLTGTISAAMALPSADFSTKTGIAKFAGAVALAAGGCVRLYFAQSPIQKVITETLAAQTAPDGTETLLAKSVTK